MNDLGGSRRALPVRVALIVAGLLLLMPATATAKPAGPGVTPIVLFPAWHFTRLTVTVTCVPQLSAGSGTRLG
jgi:hypothetical protein